VPSQWVDNGAGWLAVMLQDRQQVLRLEPDHSQMLGLAVGVIAPWDPERDGDDAQFEVRAFMSGDGMPEDPATGSLNAGIARFRWTPMPQVTVSGRCIARTVTL
jgi:predicted PhzF superfamily epimerase YddE/YHI9